MKRAICWLRRDLRLADNSALSAATHAALEVAPVFVFDTNILEGLPDRADRRVTFIHDAVREVSESLAKMGSRLVVLHGDPVTLIPSLADEWGAEAVFAAHDDDPYALPRDAAVHRSLAQDGRELRTVKDSVVFERQEILAGSGGPFRVFTPYRNAWRKSLTPADVAVRESDLNRLGRASTSPAPRVAQLEEIGFRRRELWLDAGEAAAIRRLGDFTAALPDYANRRDYPALEATSGLSVHLRHGTISIRECVRTALAEGSDGAQKWLDELIWRDFYHMVLANFPEVVTQPFRQEYAGIDWPGTDDHMQAWQEGRTGFPIVDAAMRCFNATGWMHNRLRMVTAMFLVKGLLVDWRKGEAVFAEGLLDFELSSNNGGWQWCASTGADGQPYFRIFNPVAQSRKFDPDGAFIRAWCPELVDCSTEQIHWPHPPDVETPRGYPQPIVDHAQQRLKALALYRAALRQEA